MASLHLIDRGTVFMAEAGSPHASAAFAECHVTPSGRWIVTMRTAPAKTDVKPEHVLLTWSDDQGATWSEPCEPFTAPTFGSLPGCFRCAAISSEESGRLIANLTWVDASDPELPFFNEETEGLLLTRSCLAFSEDDGETWSEPRTIEPAPFTCATPPTGPILITRQGDWLMPFETQKTYYDTGPWLQRAVMLRSTDKGNTWTDHSTVAHDPEGRIFHWDMRASVHPDGTLLAAFWTFDREAAIYRTIHVTESTDGGHTWNEPTDCGLPGQPGTIVYAGPGNLVMPYVDREAMPQIKARLSWGGPACWPAETELVLARLDQPQQDQKGSMQDAWTEMNAFSLGLPKADCLPNGDVLVIWYQGATTNHTGIHWARLRAED